MLDEFLENMGYTEEEINFIRNSYPINTYTESTLLYNVRNLVNFLRRNSLENKDIIRVTVATPQIIASSIENIKIRIQELSLFGFNKVNIFNMIKNYPYILDISNQRINNKYQLFRELSFKDEDINDIVVRKTDVFNLDISSIRNRFVFFEEYGYRKKDIINIFKSVPEMISINLNSITKKIEYLKGLGYTKSDIIKITAYLPEMFIYNKDDINSKLKILFDNGFSEKDVVAITKKIPIIFKPYYLDMLDSKIKFLLKCGFTSADIVLIIKGNPYILLYSLDVLKDNYDLFVDIFDQSNVVNMIINAPLLLGYNAKNISSKTKYYDGLGLLSYIIDNSHFLLYSLDFIKMREPYVGNSYEDLFLDDALFFTKYHVKMDDIVGRG